MYRFSIGSNLVASSMDLLMYLVDASHQSRNPPGLAAGVPIAFLGRRLAASLVPDLPLNGSFLSCSARR